MSIQEQTFFVSSSELLDTYCARGLKMRKQQPRDAKGRFMAHLPPDAADTPSGDASSSSDGIDADELRLRSSLIKEVLARLATVEDEQFDSLPEVLQRISVDGPRFCNQISARKLIIYNNLLDGCGRPQWH